MKKLMFIAALVLLTSFFTACGGSNDGDDIDNIDFYDPLTGNAIYTAAELISFLERSTEPVAELRTSIDLGSDIIRLTKARGAVAINGNGFSLTGNGDCVIRMEAGCALELWDITIVAGRNGIGTLGDASISGSAVITSVAHCIVGTGDITIGAGSDFTLKSNVGSGIKANGLELCKNASVVASGALGAIAVNMDDLIIGEGARLDATTAENYYALKCAGRLILLDGSRLIVKNLGEYHGAELDEIEVHGVVTVEATGGSKGVGLFLFELRDDIKALGSCVPDLRFEIGKGSITFVSDPSEIDIAPEEDEGDAEDAD